MFERPEEALARGRLARPRGRASADTVRAFARWLALGRGRGSAPSFDPISWISPGIVDLCAAGITAEALDALAPSFDGGLVTDLFVASNRLGPEGAAPLANLLARASLASVWAGDNQLGPEGARRVMESARGARSVWLGRAAIGARDSRGLCEAIEANGSLRALDLAVNELGPAGSVALARAARTAGVRVLCLDGNHLGADGAAALSEVLDGWSELALLRLNGTHLGDDGARTLARALAGAPALSWLGLSGNGLTDAGAVALSEAVATHPTLATIELGFVAVSSVHGAMPNDVGDRGALALASAAAAQGRLRSLDLRGSALSARAQDALAHALESGAALDALACESLHGGAQGDRVRAALARNANRAHNGREHPAVREALAPLRRLFAHWRGALVSGRVTTIERVAPTPDAPTPDELESALSVIERLRARDDDRASPTEPERALRAAVASWSRAVRARAPRSRADERSFRDERARAEDAAKISAVRRARAAGVGAPVLEAAQLGAAQRCYVCRQGFVELDPRYDRLCPACAALNHRKRAQRADMTGCVAVVTGARVRIGFRVALSLLRAGCAVVATSRFANDAWRRFASERDFEAFRQRLSVVALDLRRLPELERFAGWLSDERGAVDVLVNNAAQTIARPAAYYAAMREVERDAARALPDGVPAAPLLDAADTLGEAGLGSIALGGGAEPEDLRATNSWRASVDEVSAGELASAHAVNALAPYVLLGGLRAALARGAALRGGAFVVNVSATEGQFSQRRKSSRHPHTNMAKAALNMLTLTVADELAREKVYVTSVDPGWVSAQNPFAQAAAMAADGFAPPLDDEDGAARVLDPVYACKNGEPAVFGALLKDYVPAPW